jgi:DNA mismatch endonuclease (patch repair protein)
MTRVRSMGNVTTEERLAWLLRQSGLTGWRRRYPLPGRPDFVWPKLKVAVFADGCFWHGHTCGKNITPRTNSDAWRTKIDRTKARDRKVARALRLRGWRVLRIWECKLSRAPERCIARVRAALGEEWQAK